MRRGPQLLALLLLSAGIAAAQPILEDRDADGLADFAFACDWNEDGHLDESDIQAAVDALLDPTATVELCEGVFTVDADGNGRGDPFSPCRLRPYVCIDRGGLTLRGQGPGKTRIVKTTPHQSSPFFSTNDGTTTERSSKRLSEIHISDLEIRGPGVCGENAPSGAKGIRLVDCDHCSARHIVASDLIQAAVDFTRCSESLFEEIQAFRVGNYDYDGPQSGDGACDPFPKQPCIYNFTSAGFVAENNVFRDVVCDGVGGPAVHFRADQSLSTAGATGAWGEVRLALDAATPAVAQTFEIGELHHLTPSVVVIGLAASPEAQGELRLSVWTAPGGEPVAVVDGYDPGSFRALPLDELGPEGRRVAFQRDPDAGAPSPLAPAQRYAVVLQYSGGLDGDAALVLWDDDPTADLFESGGALLLQNGSWVEQTGRDLPMQVLNGWHVGTVVENVAVRDGTGANHLLPICAQIEAADRPILTGLDCEDAGPVVVGENLTVFDAAISGIDVHGDPARPGSFVGALRVGPFAWNPVVEKSFFRGPGDGSACVYVGSWSNGVTIRDTRISECLGAGISLGGGSRSARIERCEFLDLEAEAIVLHSIESEIEGAPRVTRDLRIQRSDFRQVAFDAIVSSSPNHTVTDLSILGNVFEEIGGSAIRLELVDDRAGTSGPIFVAANSVRGWGAHIRPGVERAAMRIAGRLFGLSMVDNAFTATLGSEDLALLGDMRFPEPGGDFWTVLDQTTSGVFSDPEPVRLLSRPGQHLKTEARETAPRPRSLHPRERRPRD